MVDYFERFEQGDVREQMLSSYRQSLRELIDPETGQPPTEDLIRQVAIQGGRFWVEGNDIDLIVMGIQRRDFFLGQQVDPRTAGTAFLESYHGPASDLPRLPASGSSGSAQATASPGTIYIGSTNIGDPLATQAADPAGLRYQVFANATTPPSGVVTLTMVAIDTGEATEIPAGTVLKWINPPSGSTPVASAAEDFLGGTASETDQEWGLRIFEARSTRPRAGNPAHFMFWGRRATNAVGSVFVYPCAQNAGSVLVAITQKRGTTRGPLARIPAFITMAIVTGYIVPAGSPVVPPRAYVLAVGVRPQSVNLAMKLGLRKASVSGWADATPWPGYVSTPAVVAASPAPTSLTFSMNSDTPLPLGGVVPQLMVWNEALSQFEKLSVFSITEVTPGTRYDVTLARAPSFSLGAGMVISPFSNRSVSLAQGIESYFDSLGPGQVVSLTGDTRAARAFRRPTPDVSSPLDISSEVIEFIRDAIGGSIGGSSLVFQSATTPTIGPVSLGPFMFVAGNIGIYSS